MWGLRMRYRRLWAAAGVTAFVLVWAPAHLPSATAHDAPPQPASGTNPSDLYDKARALDSDQPPEVAQDGFATGRREAGTNCQPLVPLDAAAPSDKFICLDVSQLDQSISPQPVLPPGAPSRDNASAPNTTLSAPIRPVPLWCELNQQIRKRFEQCTAYALTVTIGSGSTVTGTSSQLVADYSYTSNSDVAVNDQLLVSATTIVGTAAGISVKAEPVCLTCTGNAAGFTSGPMVIGQNYESVFEITPPQLAVGAQRLTLHRWELFWTVPGYAPYASPYNAFSNVVRCDNTLTGKPPGCAYIQYNPTLSYSLTGPVAEVASHVQRAQISGLPGSGIYPSARLTRTTDPVLIAANRRVVCPPNVPVRPIGKTCDEYPFASTREGGSLSGGTVRTFSGCSIPGDPVNVTGPTGFSRCMVSGKQNSLAGSQLGSFYYSQRVINYDEFIVAVLP